MLKAFDPFPMFWIMNGFLFALQGLQFFWTWMLLKFAYKKLTTPDTKTEDTRSDGEEFSEDDKEK